MYVYVSVTFIVNVIMNVTRHAAHLIMPYSAMQIWGCAIYAGMTDDPAIADFCKGRHIIVFAGVYEEVCIVLAGIYVQHSVQHWLSLI